MIEIKRETVKETASGDMRRVTILINGQPVWAHEVPMSACSSETAHDLQLLTWLWNAIRKQQAEVDKAINAQIRKLKVLV